MQVLRKLRHFNILSAMAMIHDFIVSRLLADRHAGTDESIVQNRLDTAVVTFVLAATERSKETEIAIATRIETVLDGVHERYGPGLSMKAARAAQAVLWKPAIELWRRLAAVEGDTSVEAWLKLIQHPLFGQRSHSVKGLIGR